MNDTEKLSKMLVNLANVIKAMAQTRKDIETIRCDNTDFIFLECAYLCAKMEEQLRGFIKVKTGEEI